MASVLAATPKLEGLCSQTEARWFYFWWSRVYDVMQPYFTSDEMREAGLDLARVGGASTRVLDVGAGTGKLSTHVVKRVPAANITLLDQSAQMLERAKAKAALHPCTFVLSDAHTLPFDDGCFDLAVSSGVIYYFPDPVAALREQMRVVVPGGKVLAMGSLQPKPLLVRLLACTFNRFPTEEQYVSWFKDAGLSDVTTKYISNPWNAQQYALAIVGTRNAPPASVPRNLPPAPTVASRLGALAYMPVKMVRFGLAMAAFAVVGPLQVLTAATGMRRLKNLRAASLA